MISLSKPTEIDKLRDEFKDRAQHLGVRCQVLMDGDFNSEIAIIGEGPGQEEVNGEMAFVGQSGKLLWNALRPHGILRTDCYATNVCKRQISLAKNTRHPVEPSEWFRWRELLTWELEQLPNLKYILCMGNAGIGALFGLDGITKYRGSVYKWRGRDVLVAFNPAYVLREPNWEIVFQFDCRRFANVIQGDYVPYDIVKHINPSFKDAMDWIKMMKASTAPVSYDIETIAGYTACHGLANSGHEAMCINLRDKWSNRYGIEQEIKLLLALQQLFDRKAIIAQNGNFDCHWTGYHDLLRIRNGFDTLLAHHTLYPSLPHSLAFLTSQYTTHQFYKDDIDIYKEGGDIDSFWKYNCTDAAITWEVARKLSGELKTQRPKSDEVIIPCTMMEFFQQHVMPLEPHLVQSTVDGWAVDMTVKSKINDGLRIDVDKIEAKFQARIQQIFELPYYHPNINSFIQMRDLFIDRLKAFSSTGSVDKTAREKMKSDVRTTNDCRELLFIYDEYQRDNKFRSTYSDMRVDPDDRFRATWKQQGTTKAPGRLSSAGNLWGTASNAQNQPERSHEFYVADDGTVVIYIDGSQAEARAVAYLANIDSWKTDFERARLTGTFDAHRSLASNMYKVPYDETPEEDWYVDPATGLKLPTIRYKAKRCRHGLNYRMGWARLAETAMLNAYEAKRSYILYHNETPEVKKWWAELEHQAKKERELWTPLGRRLKILQRLNDEEVLESIVAFSPQSTVGDHVKRCWRLSHEDDEWDSRYMQIRMNQHDGLLGIATPAKAKTALKIMKKHMEVPIMIQDVYRTSVEPCIIPGECKISKPGKDGVHRWSTLEKVKL